jgi:hypothetical protein
MPTRIEVVAHERIRPLLREWRESLPGTREEQAELSRRLWREFVRSIVAGRGVPEKSRKNDTTKPPTHWCGFPGGGIARILIEADRRVRLFTYVRRVVVIDLTFSPGLPGQAR